MPFASPGQTILTVGGRRVVVGGGGVVRTYAEWVAEATRLATNGSLTWETPQTIAAGVYLTSASAATGGTMTGSPWNSMFRSTGASAERVVQHGLANTTILAAQRAGGFVVFLRVLGVDASAGFVALDRNGFLSAANTGNSLNGRVCDLMIRWDATLNKAFQSNPSIGGAETEYVW